ncbi:MAG TPA: hypothetical protein VN786_01280 [Acidimicrobiales bacterium]|nr:hypothetical protein [Acidimicrobiales bacterium]
MRTRLKLLVSALTVTALVGLPASLAGAAATRTAPPLSSLQVCTTFTAQIVAKELGKHTTAQASYYPSKATSATGYASCFYRFSKLSYVAVDLYGPAHPTAEVEGSKVPSLGPTGRLQLSPPDTLIYVLSHGYEVSISGQTAYFSRSSLIALALYITHHLP